MTKFKTITALLLLTIVSFSCDPEEVTKEIEDEIEKTEAGANEVIFDDDNTVCTPYSSNLSINAQGILSVVMNPCQNSGSKLDGYFKYGSRPVAGTYTVVGTAGTFPNTVGMAETEFSMLFYGHAAETLYSTGGTITLTENADDATKLDMSWTDVTMETAGGTSLKFSGKLEAL